MYLLGFDIGSSSVKVSLIKWRNRQLRSLVFLSKSRNENNSPPGRLGRTGTGIVVEKPETGTCRCSATNRKLIRKKLNPLEFLIKCTGW